MAIEITQEDREWCAKHMVMIVEFREIIRAGRADDHVAPVAAHRIASYEAGQRDAEARLVAWLRGGSVPDHSDEGGCPFDKAARMIEAGGCREVKNAAE